MKKTIFILGVITFTLLNNFCHGQSATILIDLEIIKSKTDSLLKSNIEEIMVVQTTKPFEYLKSNDSIITFICWKEKQNYFVQIITDTNIFYPIRFKGKAIFEYPNKNKAFVTVDEQILQFIPPICGGNSICYYTQKSKNYFELTGSNTQPWTYVPNSKQKENIRKSWFEIIYTTLYKEHFHFENKFNYYRYKDF